MHPTLASISAVLILLLAGCAPASPPTSEGPSSEKAREASHQPPEVTYEPAYPEDVSDEGLDVEDVAQQTHSHAGEEDAHGDGDHDHDDHDHGDHSTHDEDDHDHGEDTHSHGDQDGDHDH